LSCSGLDKRNHTTQQQQRISKQQGISHVLFCSIDVSLSQVSALRKARQREVQDDVEEFVADTNDDDGDDSDDQGNPFDMVRFFNSSVARFSFSCGSQHHFCVSLKSKRALQQSSLHQSQNECQNHKSHVGQRQRAQLPLLLRQRKLQPLLLLLTK
jgi:hypothetical protein